jgi:4-amino-4-deoxy-L-arabinose transferase-like glycosyltransferase
MMRVAQPLHEVWVSDSWQALTISPEGRGNKPPSPWKGEGAGVRVNPPSEQTTFLHLLSRPPTWAILLLIVLLTGLAKTLLASLPRLIRWDEPDYVFMGRNFWLGKGLLNAGVPDLHSAPMLAVLSGPINLLSNNPEAGTAAVFVVCGALLPLPIYLLGRDLYGRRAGLAAAFLAATIPALLAAFLYWGSLTEPPYLLFLATALALAWRAISRNSIRYAAGAGGGFSLAYLARPEGVTYIVWFAGLLLLAGLIRNRPLRLSSLASGLLAVAVAVSAFLVTASPYIIYLHNHTGQWMLSGKIEITIQIGTAILANDYAQYDRVVSSLDDKGEIMWFSPRRFGPGLLQTIAADPAYYLWRIRRNAYLAARALLDAYYLPLWLIALIIYGWFARPWDRARFGREAFLFLGPAPLLSFTLFHIEDRFLAPMLLFAALWGGHGLALLVEWAERTWAQVSTQNASGARARFLAVAIPVAAVLLLSALTTSGLVQRGISSFNFGEKNAGLWLRDYPAPGGVMSRNGAIPLYAHRAWSPFPHAPLDQALAYSRQRGARFLVIDSWEVEVLRPFLSALAHPGEEPAPPGLRFLQSFPSQGGRTSFVWEIVE